MTFATTQPGAAAAVTTAAQATTSPIKPPRKVLAPSIPSRKTSYGAAKPASTIFRTPSASETIRSAPSAQTHASKLSDASSVAWIDPESAAFDQLDNYGSNSVDSAPAAATEPSASTGAASTSARSSPPPGLGIIGLASPPLTQVETPEESYANSTSAEATDIHSPALAAVASSDGMASNYSPFTPSSSRSPGTFAQLASPSSGSSKRRNRPDNLRISPQLASSAPTSASVNASPYPKGLASPTARGRTPPPTNPPSEPLPPLPMSASLVASTWSKRMSDEEKTGRLARSGSGISSPTMRGTPTLPFSASSASTHPYAALKNIPPSTSMALQQAMGVPNPPLTRTSRNSDPSASAANASRNAKVAVANNHIETLAGAHSAEEVLRAVQPQATFNEQQQQQRQQELKRQASQPETEAAPHPRMSTRRSDPEASRLTNRPISHLDVPVDVTPALSDIEQFDTLVLSDDDLNANGRASRGQHPGTVDEDDAEEDDISEESDFGSVHEVAIVRKGTLVSPLRKKEDSNADRSSNARAHLLRSSVSSAHFMRRPGTGDGPKEGTGAGSFFIGGSARPGQSGDGTPAGEAGGEHNTQSLDADLRPRLSSASARQPVIVEPPRSHRTSLVADTSDTPPESTTPTPGEPGGRHVAPSSTTPLADPTTSMLQSSDQQLAASLRDSVLDPMHVGTVSHIRDGSADTTSTAARSSNRRSSQDGSGKATSQTNASGESPAPASASNLKFSNAFGEIAVAFRQLQAEKRTLEKVIRATTPLEGLGEGGQDFVHYLTMMQSKLELSSSEIQKLLDLLERQRAVMDFMLETHEAELETHLDEIDDLRDELDEAIQTIEELKSANTATQGALDESRATVLAVRGETAKLRAALAEREQTAAVHEAAITELETLRKQREQWSLEKAEMEQSSKSVSDGASAAASRITQLEAELAKIKNDHEQDLSQKGADHEREIWNLKEEHERTLAENNADIERAAEGLAAHHKQALDQLMGEHLQTIDELQARIAAMESGQDASLTARRQLLDSIDAKDETIARLTRDVEQMHAAEDSHNNELKARVQEQDAELERLRAQLAGLDSPARSRSDSIPLSSDMAGKSYDERESQDSAASRHGIPSTPGGDGDEYAMSAAGMTPTFSAGGGGSKPATPITLPVGTPAEQVRHLSSQLSEQRKRETQIRSAYKQLRDDHRRLQNSHKEMLDRRRGSVSSFNLVSGSASTPGASSSTGGPAHLFTTPPYVASGGSGDGVFHLTPPSSANAIASVTGAGSGSGESPRTSRALKRLSLPLTSNLFAAGNAAGGGGGSAGAGGHLSGLPDHVLNALANAGGNKRFSVGPGGGGVTGPRSADSSNASFVGLASFPHPPGSYRGGIVTTPGAGDAALSPAAGSGNTGTYFPLRRRSSGPQYITQRVQQDAVVDSAAEDGGVREGQTSGEADSLRNQRDDAAADGNEGDEATEMLDTDSSLPATNPDGQRRQEWWRA